MALAVILRTLGLAIFGFGFGFLVVNIVPRLAAPPAAAPEPAVAVPPPGLEISAGELEQGDTLVAVVTGLRGHETAAATLGAASLPVFPVGEKRIAIAGIDVKAKTGTTTLRLRLSSGEMLEAALDIRRRAFLVAGLELPPSLSRAGITPARLTQRIAANDQAALDEIFATISPEPSFTAAFREPLDAWVDAGSFGIIRWTGGASLRHLGVDLEAKLGDPVYASNAGTVRFAGSLEHFGKTIILDHGLGIHTAYLHLSEITARVGERAERGSRIGAVGASGAYVLAPHLHFSVKIRGASVDPQRFIEATKHFLAKE